MSPWNQHVANIVTDRLPLQCHLEISMCQISWLIDFLYNVTLKWICGIERDWKTFLTLPLWHEHVAQTEIESLTLQCHLEMNLLFKARLKDFPYNATLKWTYGIRRGWCTYFKMPSWHEHDGSRMDMKKMLLDRNHHIISCLKRVCI